jgi:phosphate starvation-inducible PhoH-like protein
MALPKGSKKKPTYIREEEDGLITTSKDKRFKEPTARDIISVDDILKVPITLSPEQEQLIKLVDKSIVVSVEGGPGSGKSFTAIYIALLKLAKGEVEKIILSKPLIQSAGDEMGYLKGSLEEKVKPFLESYFDIFETFLTKQQIDDLIKGSFIRFEQIAFLRGRTFKNSMVILDEGQSARIDGLFLITSRVGSGSKLIILGDRYQADTKPSEQKFADFISILEQIPEASTFKFSDSHNYRNPFLIELTRLYNEYVENQFYLKTNKKLLKG